MVQPEDVVIALSWSGETAELAAHRRLYPPLPRRADRASPPMPRARSAARPMSPLILPKATEACPNGLAPTTSTTMQIALGDALAVALLEARGFSRQDFFVYHPGGKLGAQLKTVESIMHRGARPAAASASTRAAGRDRDDLGQGLRLRHRHRSRRQARRRRHRWRPAPQVGDGRRPIAQRARDVMTADPAPHRARYAGRRGAGDWSTAVRITALIVVDARGAPGRPRACPRPAGARRGLIARSAVMPGQARALERNP